MFLNRKKVLLFLFAIFVMMTLVACTDANDNDEQDQKNNEAIGELSGDLVVYSNRNERFVEDLLAKFAAETGVRVLPLHGANALQIEEEAGNVRADIFISNDLGALGYLHQQGLLAGFEAEGIESIDEQFRADDNAYFAISARSRGLIYNKDLISEEEMPTSMEDLLDPKWAEVENGYAITRGGNGGMIGNVSALRYEWGDEKTAEWVAAIKEHAEGIYQGHGDIRRAVGAGEHAFGLVNNYYFHQQLLEDDNNVGFIYLDQGEDQMGAIANAAGVGLVKGGPNEENAQAFIEWVLLPENQVAFVGQSLELLINSEYEVEYPAEVEPHIIPFKDLKVQDMPMKELGDYFVDTVQLIEESGLDIELR